MSGTNLKTADSPVIQRDKCLKSLNSLSLAARAEYFCEVVSVSQIRDALVFAQSKNLCITPLGAGSNVVLAGNLKGLVMYLGLAGITYKYPEHKPSSTVDVTFSAGENWHAAVEYCLSSGWYGIENLSLIPGNIGAAVIQNIGAYGVEISDVLVRVTAIDIASGETLIFDKEGCEFGYRDSIFKRSLKDRCIVIAITLRLSTDRCVNIEYPALSRHFADVSEPLSPEMVSDAVCKIRRSKLPNPNELANVGSFFKNPIISMNKLQDLQNKIQAERLEIPFYNFSRDHVKVPAAWLVEYCKFRGYRHGSAGVHKDHAIVLVNYDEDHIENSSADILALAANIVETVNAEFNISLEVEPRIYGVI
jgi:UDP-N-acetylmuramate dehydrogenase